MITLRDWQIEAFQELEKHDFSGVVKVTSGKGKTVLALYIIDKLLSQKNTHKALVVVPTINLMKQWQTMIQQFIPHRTSSFYYGSKKDSSGDIVISVINTACKGIEEEFVIKILDEVHHYGALAFKDVFRIATQHTIGLSATPEREDEGNIPIRYGAGRIVYRLEPIQELLDRFSICTIRVPLTMSEWRRYEDLRIEYYKILRFAHIRVEHIERKARQGDKYALRVLKLWTEMTKIRHLAEYKLDVISLILQIEQGKKILIFAESIAMCKLLEEKFNMLIVHSELSQQEVLKRLEEFKERPHAILASARMIDEGYDVPDADVSIIASFTRSARQMKQRDGRLLRDSGQVRRYSLVLEHIEEKKYFRLLEQNNLQEIALQGTWLKFRAGLEDDSQCKDEFNSFLEHDETQESFDAWLIRRLDYYNAKGELFPDFYEKYTSSILQLQQEYPDRWPKLCLSKKQEERIISISIPKDETEQLLAELRDAKQKYFLPNGFFELVIAVLEHKAIILTDDVVAYLHWIYKQEQRQFWSEEMYSFLLKITQKINENI